MYGRESASNENEYGGMIQTVQDLACGTTEREQMVNTTHGQYENTRERKHAQEGNSFATAPSSPQKKHRQYGKYSRARQMREAVCRFGKAGDRVAVVSFHWSPLLETSR